MLPLITAGASLMGQLCQFVDPNVAREQFTMAVNGCMPSNGMIANLYGPVEGRQHDRRMLAMSGLLDQLEQHSFSPTGQALCIYGDPAYPHRLHLQCPFARRAVLTPEEQAFNQSMSQVRVSVEWVFGDIVNYFKFVDFKKNLKIGLSSVGKFYVVSALMRNALTCLYSNTTSAFFDLQPPTLNEYFL